MTSASLRPALLRWSCTASSSRRLLSTTASSNAFALASQMLELERQAVQKRITELESMEPKETVKAEIARKHLELEYADVQNHRTFARGQGDITKPIFANMQNKRWRYYYIPRLLKHAEEHRIIGDTLPERIVPEVNVELNFQNTRWNCPYGQPVPPIWTLYSPEIVITTGSEQLRHYTLMLVDLDRPDPDSKSIEEWCHWLVTDIPVQGRLVIPGGSSPLLRAPSEASQTMLAGASFIPAPPAKEPTIPGNVVFPYVPAHPAASNPRKVHRYFLAVLEQPSSTLKLDVEGWGQIAEEATAKLRKAQTKGNTPAYAKSTDGEGERQLKVRERGVPLPLTKFMKDYDLSIKGHGFFSAIWDIHTPYVFSRLGIHEPVYGSIASGNPGVTVRQLETATELVANTPTPLTQLSVDALKGINYAQKPRLSPAKLITQRGVEVANRRIAESAKAEKKGKKAIVESTRSLGKTPRLTVLGAAAVVKNKDGDIARGFQGELVRSVKERRYRFKNV
ncbi:hypothetical protein BC832DRAFT_553064 [Gaertneriomyces semiglobifer]|nr:hypothetical protein BC832DRAFT_553064 [Gaertneriomyces semiglobifer]